MAIYKGNKKVVAVYKGSTPINKIYKGSTLVFQKSGGGGSTHLFEGTATGTFDMKINGNSIPITPDASGKWFYDTDEKITSLDSAFFIASEVTSVDLSNLDLTGISTRAMFRASSNITSIKFNNTKSMKLADAGQMFFSCWSLISLDISSFDTSNIRDANAIFNGCSSLVSLDVSNWNTSNFTTVNSLFRGCKSLTSIDLSSFNTSKLQNVSSLFEGCTSLETLDLSNFNMSKVANPSYYRDMFKNCTKLSTIKCKQAFKDWCVSKNTAIGLKNYATINWEIVD